MKIKIILFGFLMIFLISCSQTNTIVFTDKQSYCDFYPNDDTKCICNGYRVKKEVNYSVLDKQCAPISLNEENETIMRMKIVALPQYIDEKEMKQQYEEQTKNMSLTEIFDADIKFNIQRSLRNINFSIQSNESIMCFEFGGEYDSIEIDNKIINHGNLSSLYYEIQTNDCISATAK